MEGGQLVLCKTCYSKSGHTGLLKVSLLSAGQFGMCSAEEKHLFTCHGFHGVSKNRHRGDCHSGCGEHDSSSQGAARLSEMHQKGIV